MLHMPSKKSATYEKSWKTTSLENTRRIMERNQHQRYWPITKIRWEGHYCGYCGLFYKNNSTQSDDDEYIIGKNCKDLLRWNMEIAWNPKNYSQWQRTLICIKFYGRSYESIRNKTNAINYILLSDIWTNGENQPKNWHILETLCQLPTGQLDRMASSSRIPIQWQKTHSNRTYSI